LKPDLGASGRPIASYVGPVIAQDESTALSLLDRMLAELKREKIFLERKYEF
jgi:hypothetical protein